MLARDLRWPNVEFRKHCEFRYSMTVMRKPGSPPEREQTTCPDCRRSLIFVASWTVRGLWGFDDVRTYECPEHGPIFVNVSTRASPRHVSDKRRSSAPEGGDRDSLIPVPRMPKPTLNAGAIAMPEPETNHNNDDPK